MEEIIQSLLSTREAGNEKNRRTAQNSTSCQEERVREIPQEREAEGERRLNSQQRTASGANLALILLRGGLTPHCGLDSNNN